jgi:hypothetical protein
MAVKSPVVAPVTVPVNSATASHNRKRKKGYIGLIIISVILLSWLSSRLAPQANQQAVSAPTPTIATQPFAEVNVPTGYEKRIREVGDDNQPRVFSDEDQQIKVDLHAEGFWAPISLLQENGWAKYNLYKSENAGDWATVWCAGRLQPSKIYPAGVGFKTEDIQGQDCLSLRLQGRGTILFTKIR